MSPLPAATQTDFDEAVRVNVADFGMGEEEAVAAAVEELTMQGLSLTGVVKTAQAGRPAHPASIAVADLVALVGTGGSGTAPPPPPDADAVADAVRGVGEAVKDANGATIAARASAVPALLAAAALAPALAHATLASLLRTAPGDAARDEAVAAGAIEGVLAALAASPQPSEAWASAAALAAALATKNESAKAALVVGGLGDRVAAGLASATDAGVSSAAAAVAACARADDARPLTSSAFQHGRALASDGALPTALMGVLGDASRSPAAVAAACTAAKRILVNDDLVRAFAGRAAWGGGVGGGGGGGGGGADVTTAPPRDKDGVAATLAALARGAADASPGGARLAAAAAGLARQLAGSDALKGPLVEGGALASVATVVPRAASAGDAHAAVEQALGLVAALCLRNPRAAVAAVAAGCVPAVAAALAGPAGPGVGGDGGEGDDAGENARPSTSTSTSTSTAAGKAHQWAVRQACAAARNLASRAAPGGPVATALSSAGLTPLLRAARRRYPEACGDVGAAALRDLGVEDYNAS